MKKMFVLRNFTFLVIFVFTMFALSCSKVDDGIVPNSPENTQLKSAKAVKKGDKTIVEIALEFAGDPMDTDGEFNELVKALLYVDDALGTELVNTLNGTEQFTVFAPTDQAFMNLYEALDALGIDLTPELVRDVLLYHVAEGRRATNSVVPKKNVRMIETLLEVPFSVDTTPMIHAVGNTANFVADDWGNLLVDISASNGIIHVIDAVILPIVPAAP